MKDPLWIEEQALKHSQSCATLELHPHHDATENYGMNRKQFLEQPDVLGLIGWVIENIPTLPVHLKVARSRFVGKAIDCKVQGIEAVQAEYQWGGN